LKRRAHHELKEFLVIVLYVWMVFRLSLLNKSVILSEEHVSYLAYGVAFTELVQRLPHQVVGFNAVGELVFFEVRRKREAEHDGDLGVFFNRDARSLCLHVGRAPFGHFDDEGRILADLVPDAPAPRLLVVKAVLGVGECRPVKLTPEEEEVRRLIFENLPSRKVLQVLSIGSWSSSQAGER
jgi:hypothetical protein